MSQQSPRIPGHLVLPSQFVQALVAFIRSCAHAAPGVNNGVTLDVMGTFAHHMQEQGLVQEQAGELTQPSAGDNGQQPRA